MEDAKSFYDDTATTGNAFTLSLLDMFADKDHVVFGTDFSYASPEAIRISVDNIATFRWQQLVYVRQGES